MLDFIQNNESLLWALGIFSVVSFVATLAVIPWIIIRLPRDYFAHQKRYALLSRSMPNALRLVLLILKNVLGILVVGLGLIMLVIPGQGLLTILIGIILVDFPGKYALERRLVQIKTVLRSVNWVRKKGSKEPLAFDE